MQPDQPVEAVEHPHGLLIDTSHLVKVRKRNKKSRRGIEDRTLAEGRYLCVLSLPPNFGIGEGLNRRFLRFEGSEPGVQREDKYQEAQNLDESTLPQRTMSSDQHLGSLCWKLYGDRCRAPVTHITGARE